MNTHIMKVRVAWLAVLLLAGLGTGVAHAQPNWCQICDDTGDCWACCRCGGGSHQACVRACEFPFAGGAAITPLLQTEPALCSATGLAPFEDAAQRPAIDAPVDSGAASAAETAPPLGV